MGKGIKITLITLGLIGTGVGLYFLLRKKKNGSEPTNGGGGPFSGLIPTSKYTDDSFPLKNGSGGEKVKKLQKWLNDNHNAGLVVDGKFGPKTEEALKTHTNNTEATQTWYYTFVESGQQATVLNENDKDNDGIPDTIDVDGGDGTGNAPDNISNINFNPNLYNIYNPPAVQDNTYVAQSYPNLNLNYNSYSGQNDNIVIDGNTITNLDNTSPSFDNGLFIDCDNV